MHFYCKERQWYLLDVQCNLSAYSGADVSSILPMQQSAEMSNILPMNHLCKSRCSKFASLPFLTELQMTMTYAAHAGARKVPKTRNLLSLTVHAQGIWINEQFFVHSSSGGKSDQCVYCASPTIPVNTTFIVSATPGAKNLIHSHFIVFASSGAKSVQRGYCALQTVDTAP